jgi:hypothetical protein
MIRATMATARPEIMRRRLARRPVRAMFTVISFSGDAQRPFGRIGKALKKIPCSDCAAGDWQRGIRSVTALLPTTAEPKIARTLRAG